MFHEFARGAGLNNLGGLRTGIVQPIQKPRGVETGTDQNPFEARYISHKFWRRRRRRCLDLLFVCREIRI
jgi:hypothetical protein